MLFNSFHYLVFLILTVSVYWALPHRAQNFLLLVASYFFYGSWDWRFLSLIIISTLVDFWAGGYIYTADSRGDLRRKKIGLIASVATNLSILGFFKYWDFFIDSAVSLLDSFGLSVSPPLLHVILPVGISFYTFQTMSYTIDIYRGKLEPTNRLLDFAVFVAFFPQLVAGPIERARNLLPQITSLRKFSAEYVTDGLWLILIGLVRKVVIADTASVFVDRVFSDPGHFGTTDLALGLGLYSLQIYGDFSGYSNIARGSAKLLGFDLMRNFHHPYFSKSVTEFWRRWHISLSTWLRDYLYISLGGNRKGIRRTYVNLMITMLLGGLWHGASWNFVFWGLLHGAYLALERVFRPTPDHSPEEPPPIFRGLARQLALFVLVSFTWLFFRSSDLETTTEYLSGLTELSSFHSEFFLPFLVLALLTLVIDVPQSITENELFMKFEPTLIKAAVVAAALVIIVFSGTELTPFIYFQF